MSVSELWEAYYKTKDKDLRNELAKNYLNFVGYLASRIIIPLPPGLSKEDLAQYGFFGLLEAIEKYDQSKKAKFETFAGIIIHGRMMDRIREYGKGAGGPSRTSVKKSKQIEMATKSLEQRLGRHPSGKEIAEEMKITVEQYNKMLSQIGTHTQISLDKMIGHNDNLVTVDVVKNESSINPEEKLLKEEQGELLAKAIDALPPNERMVVILYYYEDLTLKEIGNFLNLSEPRISQLHTQSMIRLKTKMTI